MSNLNLGPVIIEAAVSPFRFGEPAHLTEETIAEADACVAAGAGIIHHHHDMRLDEAAAIAQLVAIGRGIQDRHPGTLVYTDYLAGIGLGGKTYRGTLTESASFTEV